MSMRKFRILIGEVIGLSILMGWLLWKYPELVDRVIPWIALVVAWHLTWEFVLDTECVRSRIAVAKGKYPHMVWAFAFLAGGLISVAYLAAIKAGMTELAAAHSKIVGSEQKTQEPHSEQASVGPERGGEDGRSAGPAAVSQSLQPVSKSSSFSTVVPVATVLLGRPFRRIPFDENINDPRADFYRALAMLGQRPFENPPGITFQEKPLGDPNVARVFLAQLLQYYTLCRIRELQHGVVAFSVTKFLGKEPAEAKAIDVPPVPVPDPVPYSIDSLFRALEGNEFLNLYVYSKSAKDGVETPHWDQPERTYWQNREHPFQVPRGTSISFSGNDHDPERNGRLERPGFYKLQFSVVPLFGAKGSLPENFYTSWPGVDSYSCRITMTYEIQQRADGGFAPNLYAQWAGDLFAGLKRGMAQ